MSIVGLGGTGKTEVALQFAYALKQNHPDVSIFWVAALSMESFEQACAKALSALGIPRAADGTEDAKVLFRQHLSMERAGTWLVVVDNADDAGILFESGEAKGVVDYLPQSGKGVILFTTRSLEVAVQLTAGNHLELGPMSQQDAALLLKKRLGEGIVYDAATTTELLDELTYLPLAIAQAASYLAIKKTSIARYLQLLRSTEQDLVELMSREFRDDGRHTNSTNAVAKTWVVSFEQICTRDAVAADLLLFISCIEWKAIPRSILPSTQSDVRMEDAIGTLCGYSFITRRGDDDWYDMHRLVHLATRIWLRQHGDAAAEGAIAMRHLARIFPSDNHANQAVWRAYFPHALRLLRARHGWGLDESARLSLRVGRCLVKEGRIAEAVGWLEESCSQRARLDEDHPSRLASQRALAAAYEANGQVKEAVKLLESVVAIEAEVLAEDHP
ncbi:hypothetical protein BU24DRAFT_382136, partial [Aaosphaeria arxii CBS 175.79]